MKRIIILLPTLLVTFFSITQCFAAINVPGPLIPIQKTDEKIQYQMRFKAGEKYYLRIVTEQKISQTIISQEQNIEQTMEIGYDFDVKNVEPNGNAWVSYTYRWAKFIQSGTGGKVVYDSSEKASTVPPLAQGFAALLGERFSLKITPQGRVEAVEGLQTVRNNVRKKLPDGPMKEAMMEVGINQFISEEGVKELMENSMAIYPEKPVGIGDSWRKTVALTQGAAMTLENEFILKDRKNGVSFIEVRSNIKSNPKGEPIRMNSGTVTYDLSGKQQGLIEIEESTGRLIRSKTNQEASGQIKVELAGQQSQQPPIPVKIDGVAIFEMTERKEIKKILDANEDVVTDTTAIKDPIKTFEGLEELLANVENQSDREITEWINGLEEITPAIAKAIYENIGEEYNFIKQQADEEKAVKTATAIDGVILYRSLRFEKIAKKLQEDAIRREALESRRGSRTRRNTRGRTGTRDSGYNSSYNDTSRYQDNTRRSRRSRSREDSTSNQTPQKVTIKLPFTDPNTVINKLKTFEGLEKELKTVDRLGIREMRGWITKLNATSPMLAKAVYQQVAEELNFAKKIAIEEKAANTTVLIDGLLVNRNERLEKLATRMVEEKRKLRRAESSTSRTRTRR